MMFFFLGLLLLGGIASIACILGYIFDRRAAKVAIIPFTVFFIGFGVYLMVFTLGFLGSYFGPETGDLLAFLVGPLVGNIGGGLLGCFLGFKFRKHHLRESAT
jgi:hypothetical protein